MQREERLVLRTLKKPSKEDTDNLSEWFCEVFGLSTKSGDMEAEMFREIAENSASGDGVTSKVLNRRLSVPRSTVIYHLNRFIYSGLVIRRGRRYYLRSEDMTSTIEELQSDMLREFSRIIEFAEKFDEIVEGESNGRRREKRERHRY